MKGRAPNKDEKEFMDKMCEIGCIVCLNLDYETPEVTPHHMEGKTRPGAHYKIIPLCSNHHQVPDIKGRWVSRHGPGKNTGKALFEEEYGTEEELYSQCLEILGCSS